MSLQLFKQDAQRWVVPQQVADPSVVTLRTMLHLLWVHRALRAMFWLRLGSWASNKGFPLAKTIVMSILYYFHGLEIAPAADIEGGLYIAHPKGTVIHARHIGRNCTVVHAVTVGMRNEWVFPYIGDSVFIGAGARVLGDIRVGDGAVIGANAVVIHDVPDRATVVGVPARVIRINDRPITSDGEKREAEPVLEGSPESVGD